MSWNLWPNRNFVLIDSDCALTRLFEVAELARLGHRLTCPPSDELDPNYRHVQPAVTLVSEYQAGINAGFVAVTNSSGRPKVRHHTVEEAARALQASRIERLRTSARPADATEEIMNGFLRTPICGCSPIDPVQWLHCWALIGEWMAKLTRPVPLQEWPRVAHDEHLTENAKKRQPSLLGWAGPAYEQAALPSLSLLQCQFPVIALPSAITCRYARLWHQQAAL